MEIEIGEVCDCLRGTAWQYVAAPHEAAKALERDAPRLGRQEAFAGEIPAGPTHRPRSRRIALLANDGGGRGLQRHPTSTVQSGEHLLSSGARDQALEFRHEVVGERLPRCRRPKLQLTMQRIWYVANLHHLGHAISMRACCTHVKTAGLTCRVLLRPQRQHWIGPACSQGRHQRRQYSGDDQQGGSAGESHDTR